MKHLRILGLCLGVVVALSAVVAASASAAVEWALNGHGVGVPMPVPSFGKLKLTDSKVRVLGSVTVECEIRDEGTVGVGGVDEIKTIEAKNCKTENKECKNPKAKAIGLPWKTQLVEVGGKFDDEIKGLENLGWNVECETILLGKIEDKCTRTSSAAEVKNVEAGVEARFSEAVSGKAKCTQSEGGGETGKVEGTDLNEGGEKEKLEIL